MEPDNSKQKGGARYQRPARRKEAEARVVQLLIKSGLFLHRELNQACQHHGLNTNQFSAVNEIIRQGPLSQKELCERLLFEKSTVSKIVKNLLDKALISVSVAPNDRRSTLLIETERGAEIWKECLHTFSVSSTELMSSLSEEELGDTLSLLKILERRFVRLAEKEKQQYQKH